MAASLCVSCNYKKITIPCMTSRLLIFIGVLINIILLVLITGTSSAKFCNLSSENWQSRIGVLISPIISETEIREIEIYWNNLRIEPGDKISLYELNSSGTPITVYTMTPNSTGGIQKTGILAEYVPSANLSYVKKCLKYRVAWITDKGVKREECLKTEPTWMKERKDIIGPFKISQIFLPGTHDSAAYDDKGSKTNILAKFAITQDLDILGQLIHGIRYLDIRVGRYGDNETWWTNHGPFYRSVSLRTIVDQVKQFLDNTEEILIMDIREFAVGFNDLSDHEALVSYLENEFRDYYLTNDRGWDIRLNDIWSSGKRLIIGYENTQIVSSHASMWPCVWHQWGNVRKIEDLYNYLHKIESNDSNSRVRPRSAMAELTPTFRDIVFNTLGNLRDMAHTVDSNVTNWYSTIWQYSANIVAVDFVRGTDIIQTAIESNENRHLHCRY